MTHPDGYHVYLFCLEKKSKCLCISHPHWSPSRFEADFEFLSNLQIQEIFLTSKFWENISWNRRRIKMLLPLHMGFWSIVSCIWWSVLHFFFTPLHTIMILNPRGVAWPIVAGLKQRCSILNACCGLLCRNGVGSRRINIIVNRQSR